MTSYLRGDPVTMEAYVTATTVLAAISPCLLRSLLPVISPRVIRALTGTPWRTFFLDFVFLIVPLQLIVLFANRVAAFLVLLQTFLAIGLVLRFRNLKLTDRNKSHTFPKMSFLQTEHDNLRSCATGNAPLLKRQLFSYVTTYRGYVNIFTAFCILAVDFTRVYPRYMSKAVMYGARLMDTGVGCFTFASAVVSPEARGQLLTRWPVLLGSMSSAGILVLFGCFRLVIVRLLGQEVPVVEYGRDWNFFFTLGTVKITATLVCLVVPRFVRSALAALIAVCYQYALLHKGLLMFVVEGSHRDGTRHNFLDANREGVISCVGYLVLYLVGTDIGSVMWRKRKTVKDLMKLTCFFIGVWTVAHLTKSYIVSVDRFDVSRRLANPAFVFWMVRSNSRLQSAPHGS